MGLEHIPMGLDERRLEFEPGVALRSGQVGATPVTGGTCSSAPLRTTCPVARPCCNSLVLESALHLARRPETLEPGPIHAGRPATQSPRDHRCSLNRCIECQQLLAQDTLDG